MNLNYQTDSKVSYNGIYMYLGILWQTSRKIISYQQLFSFVGYILSFHWYYCYLRTYISLKMIYIYILWVFIKSLYAHVLMGQLFSSLNLLGADGASGTLYEESGDIPSALQLPISEFIGVFITPFKRLFSLLTQPIISPLKTSLYIYMFRHFEPVSTASGLNFQDNHRFWSLGITSTLVI